MKFPETRRAMFVIGGVLIVAFSILIGVLGVGVVYLLGIPFLGLFAGLIFVWFSDASNRAKVIFSLVPWPLILIIFAVGIFFNTAEAETFLISSDHRGEIVVFYDEPCGEPAEFKDGRRIYRLSADGMLITQHTENDGYLNRRFFLVEGDTASREIPKFNRQDFETERKEWGTFTSAAAIKNLTKETVGIFWAYGANTYHISQKSISYLVYDYASFEKLEPKESFVKRKNFTEKARGLLDQCRESMKSD